MIWILVGGGEQPKIMNNNKNQNTSLSLYQPPQDWIDDIEKEEQDIVDDFFCNNFDVWEIIKDFKEALEKKDNDDWFDKMNNDVDYFRSWRIGATTNIRERIFTNQDALKTILTKGYWGKQIRAMGFKCVPTQWDMDERIKFCERYTQYKHIMKHPMMYKLNEGKVNSIYDCYRLMYHHPFSYIRRLMFNKHQYNLFTRGEKNINKYLTMYCIEPSDFILTPC